MKQLKDLKKGEFFTLRPIENPNMDQVWVRAGYDRSERKYDAYNYGNVCRTRMLKGTTKVYTDFTF